MRILKKIFITILVLLLVLWLGIFVFVKTRAKDLLSQKLGQAIGREVSIGSLNFVPPYSVSISELRIKDLFFVKKATIEPSIAGLLAGQRGLNKLLLFGPEVSLVRMEKTRFNVNEIVDYIRSKRSGVKKGKRAHFFIKEIIIKEGQVHFDDRVAGLYFGIMPLEVSVITSLKDLKTRVNLAAQVVSDNKDSLGSISLAGWLNFLKKDMDVKFLFNDVDVVYFAPYFKSFAKKIKSGKLFFTADMVSQANDLAIDCHLETHALKFSDDESLIMDNQDKAFNLFGNISGIVFDTLIGSGGGIFDFSIHTKFDRPRLEGLKFHGNIFVEPIKNIFRRGPEEGIETIKKIGKDFEAIGKVFKEQFKGISDMFKIKIEEAEIQVDTQASEVQESAPVPETAQ